MNNKGFMMAEVIVVSAIVLTLLSTLYISYNKLYGVYNKRINYYDSNTLYRLAYYRDILIENELINKLLIDTKDKKYNTTKIYGSAKNQMVKTKEVNLFNLPDSEYTKNKDYDEVVYLTYIGNNNKKIKLDNFKSENINVTFSDYISYLTNSVKLNSNYVLLMERCKKEDKNDCKYAYLEVYDGMEN